MDCPQHVCLKGKDYHRMRLAYVGAHIDYQYELP